MDIGRLDGATIRVPSATTRITPEGLNICGVAGSLPPPTDIVYVVDQTGSMKPNAILVKGSDTSAWYGCNELTNGPPVKMGGAAVFQGFAVRVIDPSQSMEAVKAACLMAGDPYSVRAKVVQSAIRTQASQAPLSYAATINFGPDLLTTQESMTPMSDAAGVDRLLASLPLDTAWGTNYEPPLGWARVLLHGGRSGSLRLFPSPNAKKAIVMISDGQPTWGDWKNALKAPLTVVKGGRTWTSDVATLPPIYGIFLGVGDLGVSVLDSLSRQTGGKFHQIPPNRPDSLQSVIQQILGEIIHPGNPRNLVITNKTNGQTSHSVSIETKGTSNLMPLDSLVALEPGPNALELTVQQTNRTQTANLTVVVADAASNAPKSHIDSVWSPRCGDVSRLFVKPDNSGLAWADAPDHNLQLSLLTAPINYTSVPLAIATRVSNDSERVTVPRLDRAVGDTLRAFGGYVPWRNLVAGRALAFDGVVRSASGWDSARVLFRMPRDRRDTAVATIGLHRPRSAGLTMTQSVNGPSGRVEVAVVDSGSATASVTVSVMARSGDALQVVLVRGADDVYRGSFAFQQGAAPVSTDTILQTGRETPRLDTLAGRYGELSARTLVHLPAARLRFVGDDGAPRDTLGLDLVVGTGRRVVVQAFLGDLPCLSCGGQVAVTPSEPGIGIHSTVGAGERVDSLRLDKGRLEVEVRGLSVVNLGSITWRADSIGSSLVAKPVRVVASVPDSVVYLDTDGDGSFDRAVLYAPSTHKPGLDLRLPWPDSVSRVGVSLDQPAYSIDSTAATFAIRTLVPLTTGSKGKLTAKWRPGIDGEWTDVKVVERIAPVPLRARLRRGTEFDTLRVSPSEPIRNRWDSANRLVSRVRAGGALSALAPRTARVDSSTGDLSLVFPSDSTDAQVMAGDSVRFTPGGGVRDSGGNASGILARKVVVEGSDPIPLSATLFDTDADGRADRVVLRLRHPLVVTDAVGFRWPDLAGGFQERVVPIGAASADSGKRILTFDIEPFAFGATSCPSTGCRELAWYESYRFPAAQISSFPLLDGVDPIVVDARFGYGSRPGVPDSLHLRFSETYTAIGGRPWVAWGRPSVDSLGRSVVSRGNPMLVGGAGGLILADPAFVPKAGDSVRVHPAPRGGLTDLDGNAPERLAYWTPIRFDPLPLWITVDLPAPMLLDRGQILTKNKPPVTLLVRRGPEEPEWKPLPGGTALARPIEDYARVVVTLNRIPDEGGMYIYDRMGVAVGKVEFAAVQRAAEAGLLARTSRGEFQILLAWNGCDAEGRKVATGVYLARVYGWIRDDHHSEAVNVVRKIGVRRLLPDNF
jgi:hypothetical protein